VSQATILETIIAHKAEEVAAARRVESQSALERRFPVSAEHREFQGALRSQISQRKPAVIAEIKKASPSKGLIRADFNPVQHAIDYELNGATCLSILTDEKFFQGKIEYLVQARTACGLPVLRKDFMIDEYQIAESRAMGADCILLIVAALQQSQMESLASYASAIGLDVLVEVHNQEELERALVLETDLIGINNRNLHTFETSLQTTLDLVAGIPEGKLVITESGINTVADVRRMLDNDIYGFLVGESCMRSDKPGDKLRELIFSHG